MTNSKIDLLAAHLARFARIAAVFAAAVAAPAPALGADYGLAMHGEPALSRGEPLPYANPDAPTGGTITFGALGSFDNLNPHIPRGSIAPGLRDQLYGNLVYESLLERNYDEPFALYGLLAETVSTPDNRSRVTFRLREGARFSDGEPVTVDDVVFTYELLRTKGRPNARTYYSKVERVETEGRTVTFHFPNADDRELPLILGLMPILPQHDIDPDTFGRTTLDPPVGTGPYVIADVRGGRSVTYQRNPDYWGADHPLNAGRYNADTIRFIFFRDETAMFEAFKVGELDVYLESDAGRWAAGYDFPAVRKGRVERVEIPTATPRGMFAFVMNTRRAPFDDITVRRALNHLFDFPWINRNMFFGRLRRTDSYFTNSALAAAGRPADADERALLAPFADAVDPAILDGTWQPPHADGSGRDRAQIRTALKLFAEAGWRIDGGVLRNADGERFTLEFLVATREDERLALAFATQMAPVGIDASVRYVDTSQYNARMLAFEFDVARVFWPSSLSPGNEQLYRWSARAADLEGSFNYAGAQEPAIDAMIAALLSARDRAAFESAVRALDRVLLSGHYVVPLYHSPVQWVAHASRLGRPDRQSLSGVELETFWVTP